MVDIIIAIILALGLYMGYSRGLIVQLFYLATIVVGYIVSILFSSRLAYLFTNLIPIPKDVTVGLEQVYNGLNIPEAYHKIISFVVIFILFRIVIQIIASILGVIRKLPLIKTTDRILGAILGFVEVYLIIFVGLYLITVLPTPELKTTIFTNSVIPDIILQKTPILSKNIIELFFSYVK